MSELLKWDASFVYFLLLLLLLSFGFWSPAGFLPFPSTHAFWALCCWQPFPGSVSPLASAWWCVNRLALVFMSERVGARVCVCVCAHTGWLKLVCWNVPGQIEAQMTWRESLAQEGWETPLNPPFSLSVFPLVSFSPRLSLSLGLFPKPVCLPLKPLRACF